MCWAKGLSNRAYQFWVLTFLQRWFLDLCMYLQDRDIALGIWHWDINFGNDKQHSRLLPRAAHPMVGTNPWRLWDGNIDHYLRLTLVGNVFCSRFDVFWGLASDWPSLSLLGWSPQGLCRACLTCVFRRCLGGFKWVCLKTVHPEIWWFTTKQCQSQMLNSQRWLLFC